VRVAIVVCEGGASGFLAVATVTKHCALVIASEAVLDGLAETGAFDRFLCRHFGV
jgi:hypothetical protein